MRDIAWLAVYAQGKGYGAVITYPAAYRGVPGFSNILWNRLRDNKHYLKIDPPRGPGTQVRYRCRVAGFVAAENGWKAEAQKMAATSGRFADLEFPNSL